jgi:hypothetical protein
MKRLLWVIALTACGESDAAAPDPTAEWLEFDSSCGPLALRVPPGTQQTPRPPLMSGDFCSEQYSNNDCSISLEWGSSADRLEHYRGQDGYEFSSERIDGYRTLLVQMTAEGTYFAAVNLPTDQPTSVTINAHCQTSEGRDDAIAMMRTLHLTE